MSSNFHQLDLHKGNCVALAKYNEDQRFENQTMTLDLVMIIVNVCVFSIFI